MEKDEIQINVHMESTCERQTPSRKQKCFLHKNIRVEVWEVKLHFIIHCVYT